MLKLKLKKETFNDFVSVLKNIIKISNSANDYRIKIKINKDTILIYTLIGTKTVAHLFKSYTLNTSEYIENSDDIENELQFIVKHSNKFIKQISMLDPTKGILFEIEHKTDNGVDMVRRCKIRDKNLKLTFLGDHYNTMLDLTEEDINTYCDTNNATFNFKLNTSDYSKIKNLSSLNDSTSLNISVDDNKVSFGETSKWDLVIDTLENVENIDIVFPKKLFSCVSIENESIDVYVYESFLLFKEKNNNLMMSLELTWSESLEYDLEN